MAIGDLGVCAKTRAPALILSAFNKLAICAVSCSSSK